QPFRFGISIDPMLWRPKSLRRVVLIVQLKVDARRRHMHEAPYTSLLRGIEQTLCRIHVRRNKGFALAPWRGQGGAVHDELAAGDQRREIIMGQIAGTCCDI